MSEQQRAPSPTDAAAAAAAAARDLSSRQLHVGFSQTDSAERGASASHALTQAPSAAASGLGSPFSFQSMTNPFGPPQAALGGPAAAAIERNAAAAVAAALAATIAKNKQIESAVAAAAAATANASAQSVPWERRTLVQRICTVSDAQLKVYVLTALWPNELYVATIKNWNASDVAAVCTRMNLPQTKLANDKSSIQRTIEKWAEAHPEACAIDDPVFVRTRKSQAAKVLAARLRLTRDREEDEEDDGEGDQEQDEAADASYNPLQRRTQSPARTDNRASSNAAAVSSEMHAQLFNLPLVAASPVRGPPRAREAILQAHGESNSRAMFQQAPTVRFSSSSSEEARREEAPYGQSGQQRNSSRERSDGYNSGGERRSSQRQQPRRDPRDTLQQQNRGQRSSRPEQRNVMEWHFGDGVGEDSVPDSVYGSQYRPRPGTGDVAIAPNWIEKITSGGASTLEAAICAGETKVLSKRNYREMVNLARVIDMLRQGNVSGAEELAVRRLIGVRLADSRNGDWSACNTLENQSEERFFMEGPYFNQLMRETNAQTAHNVVKKSAADSSSTAAATANKPKTWTGAVGASGGPLPARAAGQ